MKKAELLARLRALDLPAGEYWLAAGGAMVLHGLREETRDIDLGCSSALAERLQARGVPCERGADGLRHLNLSPHVELWENWRLGGIETVEGLPVVSLTGLRAMKAALGRAKDFDDIALIDARLNAVSARVSCSWCLGNELLRRYHDEEWGIFPLHDDRRQFEFLTLEVMQCGLSWMTVLNKRAAMRAAFDGFDPVRVAAYDEEKIASLLTAPGIIHSAPKLRAMAGNARAFLRVQAEFGSFDAYFWRFSRDSVLDVASHHRAMPAQTPLSARLSRDLRARGFRFLGPVVVYSHMQAAGMVNDHDQACFGRQALGGKQFANEEALEAWLAQGSAL